MAPRLGGFVSALLGAAPATALLSLLVVSPYSLGQSPDSGSTPDAINIDVYAGGGGMASALVHVPVTNLVPGSVAINPPVQSPVANDPQAAQRGMQFFMQFNCVGCHAPNGAGGMGPALSNRKYIYGSEPEQIYLSILQGRPQGMPAWSGMLPDAVIWDLVAYVKSLSRAPSTQWGTTTSTEAFKEVQEQVPAEHIQTAEPWAHTERFGFGQAPNAKVDQTPAEPSDQ